MQYGLLSLGVTALILGLIGLCLFPAIRGMFGEGSPVSMTETGNESDSSLISDEELYPVPNFVGQKWEDILANSANKSFKLVELKGDFSDNFAEGVIMSQDVAAGAEVPYGTPVGISISQGTKMRAIPNIIGQNIATADKSLTDAGLRLGEQTEEYNASIPFGCIIDINGAKVGDKMAKDSLVNVRVSLGANPVG